MSNAAKIILFIVILGGVVLFTQSRKEEVVLNPLPTPSTPQSIEGCYVARLEKDVYTLNIQSEVQGSVVGTLAYNNFEKDSSRGLITGTYEDNILLAEYAFTSEGMNSVRQVIFKKMPQGFVQGFGPVVVEGDREEFVDVKNVDFGQSPVFIATACEAVQSDS